MNVFAFVDDVRIKLTSFMWGLEWIFIRGHLSKLSTDHGWTHLVNKVLQFAFSFNSLETALAFLEGGGGRVRDGKRERKKDPFG